MQQPIDIEALCAERGLRITEQRRVIARVLSESQDHPDVDRLHARATEIDPRISIATVYRTVRLFEEAGILDRHDFGDGRARYEAAPEAHHDHMIDVESGKVIEFVEPKAFEAYGAIARAKGFLQVASSPLTRSSYHAGDDFKEMRAARQAMSSSQSTPGSHTTTASML